MLSPDRGVVVPVQLSVAFHHAPAPEEHCMQGILQCIEGAPRILLYWSRSPKLCCPSKTPLPCSSTRKIRDVTESIHVLAPQGLSQKSS